MYIIIENECIDATLFTKVKLYKEVGIIAFLYKHNEANYEVELPITFDETHLAEKAFNYIMDKYEECDIICRIEARASVPAALLAKMKRRLVLSYRESVEYTLNKGLNVQG